MKIEVSDKLTFEGYNNKELFQNAVINILIGDDEYAKYRVFFIGRCEDVKWKYRHYLFGYREYNNIRMTKKEVDDKWNALLTLTNNPEYCNIMWKRITDKCKFVKEKPKLKKDGTIRKPPIKKNKNI